MSPLGDRRDNFETTWGQLGDNFQTIKTTFSSFHLIISRPWVTNGGLEDGSRASCLIKRCADFGDGFCQKYTIVGKAS